MNQYTERIMDLIENGQFELIPLSDFMFSDICATIKRMLEDDEDELTEQEIQWYDDDLERLENLFTLDQQKEWVKNRYNSTNYNEIYAIYKAQDDYDDQTELDTLLSYLTTH